MDMNLLEQELKGAQTRHVRVESWANWRGLIATEHFVVFQVTIGCRHCPTCQSRVEEVESTLRQTNIPFMMKIMNGMGFLVLPRESGEDPIVMINRVTGLRLRRMGEMES